jgi:two-component system invasion response regulator UvrY
MRTGAPPAPPASYQNAVQQFLDRRRKRLAETFTAHCDSVRALVDKVAALGPAGPVAQLRQLTRRLSGLAGTMGVSTVRTQVSRLERIVGGAGGSNFDVALAHNAVDALRAALNEDLARTGEGAGATPMLDGILYVPVDGVALQPKPRIERRGRKRLVSTLRVLIVDDHAMLRRGLRALLSDEFKQSVFGEACDAPEALTQLRRREWDIALVDISLPGKSGLDLIKEMKTEWPALPVLVLSGHTEDQFAVRTLKAGAGGYLTKESAPEELVKAVRKILAGGRYASSALAEQLASTAKKDPARAPHELLSDREFEVMARIASGKTVTEIADELSLSAKTISTYRTRILEKLGVKNSAEIVQYALRNGVVT